MTPKTQEKSPLDISCPGACQDLACKGLSRGPHPLMRGGISTIDLYQRPTFDEAYRVLK